MVLARRETGKGFAAADSDSVVYTASTTERTLFSHTIPGGYMGISKELKFVLICTLTTPMVSVPTITVRVKLGSSTITIMAGLALALNQTNAPFIIEGTIANANSVTNQIVFTKLSQATTAILTSQPMTYGEWTANTAVDQIFAVTVQFGAIAATTNITYKHASVELT